MVPMIRRWFLLAALACALPALPALAQGLQNFAKETLTIRSQGKEHRLTVEIARTPAQQAQGLMYRRRMAADAGMLFLHTGPRRAQMWMKNTYIPLDMLFIAPDGRIDQIVERTTPHSLETIVSNSAVSAVLELNAGTAYRLGLKPGDRVVHPAFTPPG
jgi:uncharacterized membrane protein (UPF0127 family)